MKLVSMLAALMVCAGFSAQAGDFKELTDFPKQWSGEAGDLVNRVAATLDIQKIELVKKEGKGKLEVQEYNVTGNFKFGSRSVAVTHASVISDASTDSHFGGMQISLTLSDSLTPRVFVSVVYNKDNNEYVLKDLDNPPSGHRMILKTQAN